MTAPPPPRPPRRRWPIAVGLLAAAVAGSGYYLAPWRETPEEAWAEVSAAAAAGDYGAVWDRMDPSLRARLAVQARGYPGAADRDRFIRWAEAEPDVRAEYLPAPVVRVVHGEYAAVYLDGHPKGGVNLVRRGGRWLLCDGRDVPGD